MDDLDYLYATARIRAMENKLIGQQQQADLIKVRTLEDAAHLLTSCGWENVDLSSHEALEKSISSERRRSFAEVRAFAPDKSMIAIFQLKYDYHNIKAALKGQAQDKDYTAMLSDCGSIDVQKLSSMIAEADYSAMSPPMRNATADAQEILNRTGDPQLSDMELDKACYREMLQLAQRSESTFLKEYVHLQIDAINLRTAVRLKRRGLPYEYLRQSFIPGGAVALQRLLTDLTPDLLESAFAPTQLSLAASVGGQVLRGEARLVELDIACDNALMEYLHSARSIGLGEQPLVAYLAAKEAELMAVRIIISGRMAGMDGDTVRERLRETYV